MQKLLNAFRVEFTGSGHRSAVDDGANATEGERNVLSGISPSGKCLLEGFEGLFNWTTFFLGQALIVWVDQQAAAKHGFVFEIGRHLLGQSLVGHAADGAAFSVVVDVADVVRGVLFLFVFAAFEDGSHGFSSFDRSRWNRVGSPVRSRPARRSDAT
ncbi:MAG: hypothetical protein ACYC6N_13720 [Pirellulaceae bacterium]